MAFSGLEETVLWDGRITWCAGFLGGLPVWRYGDAPKGLVTKSQLREQHLRRHRGQEPVGYLIYRWTGREPRFTELYRIELALLSRPMSDNWRASIDAMQRAHRTCRECGVEQQKWLPQSTWKCNSCLQATDDWGGPAPASTVTRWKDTTPCAA